MPLAEVEVLGDERAGLQDTLAARLGAPGRALVAGGSRIPPSVLHRMPAQVRDAFDAAVVNGLHATLISGAAMALLAFLVAWLVREVPLRGWETDTAAPDPATVE